MTTKIRIYSQRDGFRRAGVRHPRGPVDHPVGAFTEEQLAILKDDPVLTVAEIDVPDAPEPANEGGSTTPTKPTDPEEMTAAIVEAIGKLDKDSAEAWTKGGAPQVSAIEAELGFQISGEQRDQAWAKIQAEAAKDNKNNT